MKGRSKLKGRGYIGMREYHCHLTSFDIGVNLLPEHSSLYKCGRIVIVDRGNKVNRIGSQREPASSHNFIFGDLVCRDEE